MGELIITALVRGPMAASKAASQQEIKYSAFVYPDSTGQSVLVQDIKLDFRFGGIGIYMPDKYPTIKYVPLETGEQIQFPYLLEVLFKGKRVEWKQFVEPDRRDEYDNIDEKGYRHWSEVEVQTTVIDLQRRKIQSRLNRPDYANVYLIGKTEHGDFKLRLDQENGKTVRVVFKHSMIMQCKRDSTHKFPNSDWKYCPICGGQLVAVPVSQPKDQ